MKRAISLCIVILFLLILVLPVCASDIKYGNGYTVVIHNDGTQEYIEGIKTFLRWDNEWRPYNDEWDISFKNISGEYIADGGTFKSIFKQNKNIIETQWFNFSQRPDWIGVWNHSSGAVTKWVNAQPASEIILDGNKLTYKNVFNNVDYEFLYDGVKLKENIVSHRTSYPNCPGAQCPYQQNDTCLILATKIFDINKVHLEDDNGDIIGNKTINGILKFKDVVGDIKAYLPVGYASSLFVNQTCYDEEGVPYLCNLTLETKVKNRVIKQNGEWNLYSAVSYDWIEDANRTGDIIIDPSWIVGIGGNAWSDNVTYDNTTEVQATEKVELRQQVDDYVSYWRFDENTGTLVNDENVTNNNTGTLMNSPTWNSSGVFGSALSYDGANDYVSVPDAASLDITDAITIEAWANLSELSQLQSILSKGAYSLKVNADDRPFFSIISEDVSNWTNTGDLTSATDVWSLAVFNGKLYGGTIPNGDVFVYDEDLNTWTNTGNLASAGYVYTFAVFGGKLYAGTYPNGDVFVYDEDLNTWTNTGNLASATEVWSLAVFNGKLYAATIPNGDVFVYDEDLNTWTNTGNLASVTDVRSLALFNGKLYAGTIPNGDVFVYDEDLNTWTNTGDLASATRDYSLAVYNGKLYAGTYPNGDVFVYDEDLNTWTNTGNLASATLVFSLAVFNGKLYGGTYPNGNVFVAGNGAAVYSDTPITSSFAHIAATYDKTKLIIYVNGVKIAERNFTVSIMTNSLNFLIGNNFGGENLNGTIDEVRIYNRALSNDEINQTMNNLHHILGNLTSFVKDATSGYVWQNISFNATIPENTNVSIYTNTSDDNITFSGWQIVQSNANSNQQYTIPQTYQKQYGAWELVLEGNVTKTPEINNVTFYSTEEAVNDTTFIVTLPIGYTYAIFNAPNSTVLNLIPNGQTSSQAFYNVTNTGNVNLSVRMQLDIFEYQENANVSECCGVWSVSYPCTNIYDGNWSTYGKVNVTPPFGIYYANYTKPSNVTRWDSYWEVKLGFAENAHTNLTVPILCWNQNPIELKMIAEQPNPYNEQVRAYCYNGSDWQYMYGYDSNTNCIYPYEEAMRWSDSIKLKADIDNTSIYSKEVNSTMLEIYDNLSPSDSGLIWIWSDLNKALEQNTNKTLSINVTQVI